jgi:hypothetical protein
LTKEEKSLQAAAAFECLGVMIVRSDALDPWRYQLRNGPPKNPHFRERFQQFATDAALLIGSAPRTATPVAFWLDRLFRHSLNNWPDYVFAIHDSGGGSLNRLCESSAAYCAWWDRQIIEVTRRNDSDVHPRTIAIIDALTQIENNAGANTPVQSSAEPSETFVAAERKAALIDFKAKGRKQRIRITDEMVAQAANPGKWNDRTMITWWKRDDKRVKAVHDKKIRAVLGKDPSEIWKPNSK